MSKEQDSIKYLQTEYPDIYDGVSAIAIATSKQMISDTLKRQEFDKAVKAAYPNWEAIWYTPEFQRFLQETHEYSGVSYQVLLNDAFGKLDSERVIRIFGYFVKWKSSSQHTNRTQSPMSVAEAKRALVKLSQDKVRGKFRGSEADFKKREAELQKIILGV